MQEEKRGFARLYIGAEVEMILPGSSLERQKILLQDISATGMRFVCGQQWDTDGVIKLKMQISGVSLPMSVTARIVWQKQMSPSYFETGVEFCELDDSVRQALESFIQRALGRVEERRKFIRCNISTLIHYRPAGEQRFAPGTCLSMDISKTGMKVMTREPLSPGALLTISFQLPDDAEEVVTDVRVVWAKRRDDGVQELGIEYVSLPPALELRIAEYIKRTLGLTWI